MAFRPELYRCHRSISHSDNNDIGVRSFILSGAPLISLSISNPYRSQTIPESNPVREPDALRLRGNPERGAILGQGDAMADWIVFKLRSGAVEHHDRRPAANLTPQQAPAPRRRHPLR
jgi:hypothetical protein